MDEILLIKAAILGVVEGLTEFLPISSTGHLILASSLLGMHDEKGKLFEIFIQTGAILAICWEYRRRLAATCAGLWHEPSAQRFALGIALAFLPLAILGLLFGKQIKAVLFAPVPVAIAFIVGGLIILWVERRQANCQPRVQTVDEMSLSDAVKLGLAQAFALIPGTSRSGATIMGGMLFGLSRKAATEFSFFLAIPTLILAGLYELLKQRHLLAWQDIPVFAVGLLTAFISALVCVRWLLRYVSTHSFVVFAWYRIAFGIVILVTAHTGMIAWH
ncbi:undecaprenyl-diphosphate phosphatase [Parvibium lacunae]|uniref:Undecaprenyl-diphosphatase n=1 Tax=Parvibium lacunae TaxID=1888893 RepID=A0A368L1E3_9BURK|nr:undecaprenyl-diphosphate phosphatase [Parvibium lacunae]RCS57375.1 undecaprenyl-diphosphate phosphatase [Parvibium lacunae]